MKLNEIKQGKSVADLGKKYEGGNFNCKKKGLTSLEGAPQKVGGYFDCSYNLLTSLEGAPLEVRSSFNCESNNLTSLEGAPREVGGYFDCSTNQLTSLKGAPQKVGGDFYYYNNKKLTSLKNIHRYIKKIGKKFFATYCPIKSHVVGLLLIKDLQGVDLDNKEVAAIINSHLDGGSMRSAMDCQHALIKAGYPEFAKL